MKECIVVYQNSMVLAVNAELSPDIKAAARFQSILVARTAARALVQSLGDWACLYPALRVATLDELLATTVRVPNSLMFRHNVPWTFWRQYEKQRVFKDDRPSSANSANSTV
jgi:hypothetical protein